MRKINREDVINYVKKEFDVVFLGVLSIFFATLGTIAILIMWIVMDCDIRELLTAGFSMGASIGINCISIYAIRKKKSTLLPVFGLITNAFLFFIWMLLQVLLSILLVLTVIALIFCIKRRNLLPKFRTRSGLTLGFLTILILSMPLLVIGVLTQFCTITLPAHNNPNFKPSFCLQFYETFDLTDEQLNLLAKHNARIYLVVTEDQMYTGSLAHTVAYKLNLYNVEVYGLPVLDYSDGVYAADNNVDLWFPMMYKFMNWTQNNSLTLSGILLDTEPDAQRMGLLQSTIYSGNLFAAVADLKSAVYSNLHNEAIVKFTQLIEIIESEGYETMYSAFPMVMDDVGDWDAEIQALMGTPVIPPNNWDYHGYMIYRTVYVDTIHLDLGSYLVYSYSRSMAKLFDRNGAVALCCAGRAPYGTINEFIKDAFIAKNLGFPEFCIWSYELTVNNYGVEGLELLLDSIEEDQAVSFYFDPITALIRFGTVMVDLVGIL